mgnify:CR=1 FL=1
MATSLSDSGDPARAAAASDNRVVVIGSGFGGLAAAIRLQARGYQVTLVEQRDQPGGRAYVAWQAAANVNFAKDLTFSSSEGIPSVLRLRRSPDGARCAALGGAEEGPYACAVYEERPRTCRDFTRGSAHCLSARRRVGLSV